MAVNVINPNKGRVYFAKDGLVLDSANLDKYHPNSNVNTLQVNIEDGGMLNSMALINYQTPNMAMKGQATTSHWYPLFFIGINNVKVANEGGKRTFAQYLTPVPVNILNRNLGKATPMNVTATVKLVGGINFLGLFDSVENLQTEHPASEALDDDYAIGGVIDVEGNVTFYQVEETSTDVYEWVEENESVNPLLSVLESKQYNITNISVQGGFGNATPLPLATQHFQILWQAINNQGIAISDLDNKLDTIISLYQDTIHTVLETNTINPTITTNLPNGKQLELDVKISENNDLIEVESDGLKVTNEKVDDRIDLKTNPIQNQLDAHLEDLDNPHGVTAEQVDTYVKTTIDNKDANTLQSAKDYTDILGVDVEQNKQDIENIEDGTTVVKKAEQDENGNNIKDTYATITYVDGKISSVFRPSGNWNANTNTPTLSNNDPTNAGKVYYVTDAGTQFGLTFAVGDKLAFIEGGVATKWDNVDDVVSVNSKVGAVQLNADDIPFNGSGTNYVVNKLDVESAIKELDTQLALKVNASDIRGYNLAMPDLTGKPEISTGIYRLYNDNGVTIDYNVNSGIISINGTTTQVFSFNFSDI